MIQATLKNNKTGEKITSSYTARQLLENFFGESDLMENMIENQVCDCNAVGETNVVECGCWERWEDCTLVLDSE